MDSIRVVGDYCMYRHVGGWRGMCRKDSFGRMSRIALDLGYIVGADPDSGMDPRIYRYCVPC
jgi:hypothetical protein